MSAAIDGGWRGYTSQIDIKKPTVCIAPRNSVPFALVDTEDLREAVPSKNPGLMIAVFVVVGGWLVYDMATTREAQSTAVVTLQYIFLAGIAIGLVGAVPRLMRPN